MHRIKSVALTVALAALLSPATSIAQGPAASDGPGYGTVARQAASRPITVGTSHEGRLTASDPTFPDNSHFQVWRFAARAGQDLVVALESRDFDAVVMLVEAHGESQQPLQLEMADSARTARLATRIPADGEYLIVANTLQSRRTGDYRLSLETLSEACAAGGPCVVEGAATSNLLPINRIDIVAARPIALGESHDAELTRADLRLRDSSLFDAWRFEGSAGQRIVIDHSSADFDTYLVLARQTPDGPQVVRENDDAPDTQNSQLAVELTETGTYVLVATSLRPDTVGRYTLRMRSMADACASGGPCDPTANPSRRQPLFAAVPSAPKTVISRGDTVSARLGRGDPLLSDGTFFDAYRFTGSADEEVAILLSSRAPDIDRLDTFLHLVRVDNDSVVVVKSDDDGGTGRNSMVTARLPRDGEYVLLANGLTVADSGNYLVSLMGLADACASLRVCEVGAELPAASPEATILASPATVITLGDTVVGRLEIEGPKLPDGKPFQVWRYTARAGERVVITNRSSDFDAYLHLYHVGGNLREVERNDDGGGSLDAQISAELAEGGDYLIVAGSFSTSAAGDYRLSIEDMRAACAAGGPCAPGETSAERARLLPAATAPFSAFPAGDTVRADLLLSAPLLSGRGRFQSYRFAGQAGQRIVITMDAEQFDPYLELALLRGASPSVIGSDDDGGEGTNARLVAVLPETGTYLLVASALSADSTRGVGSYALARGLCDDACAAYDGTPAVRTAALGALAMRAERRPIPPGGMVADSLTPAAARRTPGATFHAYSLRGITGRTLRASLQSTEFDPYLVIFLLEGDSLRMVQSDDDGGESTNSLIEWQIDRAATYVIVATAYTGSSSGSYLLHAVQDEQSNGAQFAATVAAAGARAQLGRAVAAPHSPLPVGAPVAGELTEQTPRLPGKGRFQSFRFSGREGERVVITMESVETDPYLYLASLAGGTITIVGTDDDGGAGVSSRLVATLPSAGEYLVVATAYTAGDTARIARYTIKLDPCDETCAAAADDESSSSSAVSSNQSILSAPRRTLESGAPLRSALAVGDSTLADGSYFHAYALEATAGATVRASMESSAFDTFLYLYRVEGDSLVRVTYDDDSGEDTNSLIEWTVDTTGSYIVVANALSRDSHGEYTLTVSHSVPQRPSH